MNPMILILAMAAATPDVDPQTICQSARAAALDGDKTASFDSCVRDERTARDELRKRWSQFSAEARSTCAQPEAVTLSYVEVLTCLEMQTGSRFGMGKTGQPAIEPNAPAGSTPTGADTITH